MDEGERWAGLSPGDEFAGYRIERRLGRGGMGIVYLAIEPGLDRRVALKLIAPEAAADEVFARALRRTSRGSPPRSSTRTSSRSTPPARRTGFPTSRCATSPAPTSASGSPARRQARARPAAVALIAQVGNGLDAIHAAGLVHRDVKPANVLLSGDAGSEHAYITDFGVARNVAIESGLTQTGRFVGTLDYVAPEQISRRAGSTPGSTSTRSAACSSSC